MQTENNRYAVVGLPSIEKQILQIVEKMPMDICVIYGQLIEENRTLEKRNISCGLKDLCMDGYMAFDRNTKRFLINDILKHNPEKFGSLKEKYGTPGYNIGILSHHMHYEREIEKIISMDAWIKLLEEGDKARLDFLERTVSLHPHILADKRFCSEFASNKNLTLAGIPLSYFNHLLERC